MAAGFHLCDMSLHRLGFYEGTPAVHDTGVTQNVMTHQVRAMVPMPSSQCPMVPVGDGILEQCGSLAALISAFRAYPTNTMAFGKQQFCFHLINCLGESVKLPNILLSKAKTPAILASPPKVAVPSPWPFQLLFSMPSPLCPPGEQGPELPTVPQS